MWLSYEKLQREVESTYRGEKKKKPRVWEEVHERFRLSLKKWLYPGDNNSIAEVIGMAKEKEKSKVENQSGVLIFILVLYQPESVILLNGMAWRKQNTPS